VPQVEVTFDIDANGILNVSAKDMATHKEQKITITASTGLSKEEAEKMRNEAESHAAEDKQRLAEIEARNMADAKVYQMEKLVRENREKVSESDVKPVEEALENVRKALADGKLDQIKAASDALDAASNRFAEALYKAGAAQAGSTAGGGSTPGAQAGGAAAPGGKGPGDVIDAEYVDVDESKKPN
jgi:molecular chaperone DnaK